MRENLHSRPLVAIAGPTGSGKSSLAIRMAEIFHGEIVNCDSIQIYRLFNIGAAKTPENERRRIPHHLIDVAEPGDVFTAGDFSREGRLVLHDIAARSRLPIVAGGTGFYLRALIDGLAPGPRRDDELRASLAAREKRRPGALHRILRRLDSAVAKRIHPNDVPKVTRALEICLAARKPATEVFAEGRDRLQGFRVSIIGLFPDREQLYKRLSDRVEWMFSHGIIEETAAILARGYPESAKPFEAIGYKQALQTIHGELSQKEAVIYAKRATNHYAKRQMTWFRQQKGIEIVRGFGDDPAVVSEVERRIREFLSGSPDNLK